MNPTEVDMNNHAQLQPTKVDIAERLAEFPDSAAPGILVCASGYLDVHFYRVIGVRGKQKSIIELEELASELVHDESGSTSPVHHVNVERMCLPLRVISGKKHVMARYHRKHGWSVGNPEWRKHPITYFKKVTEDHKETTRYGCD